VIRYVIVVVVKAQSKQEGKIADKRSNTEANSKLDSRLQFWVGHGRRRLRATPDLQGCWNLTLSSAGMAAR
jgi:hypothetical protein